MNMKNKHWFSFSLFREGLRQLRVITCLFSLLAAAYGVLSNVSIWVDVSRYRDPETFYPILRSMPEAQPLLMISFCVLAPILTLYMFRFLNSRRDSDFYHALPENRICLFNSFFAAILASIAIYMAVCILSVGITCLLLSSLVRLDWGSLLQYTVHLFAASFYVAAFVSIAMTVSGTFISNVVVSGLLIFGPHIILTVIKELVFNSLPFIPTAYQSSLFNNNYNIVNGLIFGLLGNNYSYSIVLTKAAAFWCTLAMSLVLTVIAAVLFYYRKSEAAGQSAPNRVLGAIYRLSIAYMVSLIPLSIIFDYKTSHISVDRVDIFHLFILYLIVAAVFYLYELLMTKKLKRLWKITPSFLLIPVLNVLTFIIISICYSQALSFTPDSSEITGVQFMASRTYRWDQNSYLYDYYDKEAENIPLTDDVICEIIARNLAAETEALQNGEYWRYTSTYNNFVNVAVVTDGKTAYRSVYMSGADMSALANQLSYNPQLEDIYSSLPDRKAASFQMTLDGDPVDKDSALANDFYQALQQDMEEMGFAGWYSYVHQHSDTSYTLADLYLSVSQNGSLLVLEIPITPELPYTASVYLNTLSGQQEAVQEISAILDSCTDGTFRYIDLFCQVYLPDGHQYGLDAGIWVGEEYGSQTEQERSGIESFEDLQAILRTLETESTTPLRLDQVLVNVYCHWDSDSDDYHGSYNINSIWIGFDELPESFRKWIAYQYDEEIAY